MVRIKWPVLPAVGGMAEHKGAVDSQSRRVVDEEGVWTRFYDNVPRFACLHDQALSPMLPKDLVVVEVQLVWHTTLELAE